MSKPLQKIYTIVTTEGDGGDGGHRYLVSMATLPDETEEQFAMRAWKLIFPDSLELTHARKVNELWVVLTTPDETQYSLRGERGERLSGIDWAQIEDDIRSGCLTCLDIMPLDLDNIRTL